MSIDLWSQFVDYLSAPSIGGFVRWVVPAFSGVLLIVKNIQVILDNLDSNRLFGLRYKIRAHKYLSLIDNVEGLDGDSRKSVNSLKNALFDDVKVDIIHAYLNERYKRRFDRFTSELLIYSVAWFVIVSLLTFAEHLLKQSEGKVSDVETQYALLIISCSLIATLPLLWYILIELPSRFLRFLCARKLLSRKKMNELSLNAILSNLNPGQPYLFIDATVRSGIPSSPVIGNRYDVSMLDCIDEQQLDNLKRFELCQVLSRGSGKRVSRLVESFLQAKECRCQDLVCFVYSRYGLSAIRVTDALRNYGIDAYSIGKVDGRTKELSRTIKEVELLRACGLK